MESETTLLTPTKKGTEKQRDDISSAIDISWFNYYIKGKLKVNSHCHLAFGKMLQRSNELIWKTCLWKFFFNWELISTLAEKDLK